MALPTGATLRSNLFVPEVFTEAIRQGFAGVKALLGTDVAIINGTLPAQHRGGAQVMVPYFNNIGEVQDAVEGQALTVAQLTQATETATVNRSGIAFDMTRWAELAAAEDPYAEAASQVIEGMSRRTDLGLIQASAGDTAVGAAPSTSLLPIGAAGTSLVENIGSSTLNYDTIVDAKMLWGDEQDDISLMAVHSATFGNLLHLKDSTGRPLVTERDSGVQGLTLYKFVNIPIIVSDRLVPQSGVYTSLIYKKRSLVFWYNLKPAMTTLPDPLTDSEVTALNMYWVAYMYKNMPGKRKPGVVAIQHGN